MNLLIQNLEKTYPNGVRALDNLNLEIGPGMFGLLGPNGAGKSSLMRTIATLQQPDSGTLTFAGLDILRQQHAFRRILGYLPQEFGVYPKTSAVELLDYFAVLKGISSKKDRQARVQEVLELTNLYEVRKQYVSGYSGGMKQRFGIAQLLLNQPKLLIVDEPTAGLDPAERTRFLNVIRAVATDNVVIFSTHIVDDVKDLCHEMAVMNHGRVLAQMAPATAIGQLAGKVWTATIDPTHLSGFSTRYPVLSSGYDEQHQLTVRVFAEEQPAPEFTHAAATLEDVYFYFLQDPAPANN
ncbi:MAG: multidrug ABC transporter ATP-binding protein [Bacteroidetes bacterium]|nr:MAG: multidrug ABC transporter ATP-binding protein [Bacteroidota bacterium]PTM12715.1 MAG: multidrug ABC transporter ATP-binding protein [Bacteroidota bacterium]